MAGEIMKVIRKVGTKHGSEILVGVAIVGMGSAVISAWKGGTKASRVVKEECRIAEQEDREYKAVDMVKDTWKYWLPPLLMFAGSTVCIIGSNRINAKQKTALLAACKLAETSLADYKREVVKQLGEKKERKIYDGIAQEHYDAAKEEGIIVKEKIIHTGKGNYLCYDPASDRYFYSDWNAIKAASIEINKRIINDMEMYASLNDFYDELGLPRTILGDAVGWNVDYPLEISDSYCGDPDDGEPAVEINYIIDPRADYQKYM